jgi:hypothetical protein
MFPERTYCVCVAYLRQKSRVNFRSTKVDAGKLKFKYLHQPWSTLAVKVLRCLNKEIQELNITEYHCILHNDSEVCSTFKSHPTVSNCS